jgi:bis(5'-nucleosyl)-tetraphosphatase (symmetrical)
MAIYVIGDLQGCYDPFRHLLDELAFDPDKDKLWLTGDLVNRGPKSLKTLRFVKSLGDSAISVLGNHDLHLLALAAGSVRDGARFDTLRKTLRAKDRDELLDWLRHRPLAHYDKSLDTLLVHAGTYPGWSVKKTLARAAEVETELRSKRHEVFLGKMYGNTPSSWSGNLTGYKRLRFIVNCLTRMRMLTPKMHLNFSHSGSPWRARKSLVPWYDFPGVQRTDTRIVFGHWSQLGLIVLPDLIGLDTGCIWGRQLTAVRLDKRVPRVYQVRGQLHDL